MDNIKLLTTDKQKHIDAAKKLLEDAIDGEFDTIVIIGINDKNWEVFNSAHADGFKLLGMLEVIKLEKFKQWAEGDDDA